MPFGSAKKEAALAPAAATIGGRVGWPTDSWLKGKRLLMFSPLAQLGSKSAPISGTVAGRVWASFRVSSKLSRSMPVSTEYLTCRHTGVILPDTAAGLPVFTIVSRQGGWEKLGVGRKSGFASGDAVLDQSVLLAANETQRPRVGKLLTDEVKAAIGDVVRADRSALIKVAGDEGMLLCWIDGEDARDAHFPPLLRALARLADSLDVVAGSPRRGGIQG
jgi:hypothetical protein